MEAKTGHFSGNGQRSCRHGGMVLILLLILIATIAGLASAYLSSTSVRMVAGDNYAKAVDVGYAAESGVQHGLCLLAENATLLNNTSVNPLGPYTLRTGGPTYMVSASALPNAQYSLTGTGILGTLKRTCTAVVRVDNPYYSTQLSMNPRFYWRLGDAPGSDYATEQMAGRWGWYATISSLNQPGRSQEKRMDQRHSMASDRAS